MEPVNITDLPPENIQAILLNSTYEDIVEFCRTSSQYESICRSSYFWATKAEREFGYPRAQFPRPGMSPAQRYLELRVDIASPDAGLCRAALANDLYLVGFLIDKGALLVSCTLRLDWDELVIQRVPLYPTDNLDNLLYNNALDLALKQGNIDVVKYILTHYDMTKSYNFLKTIEGWLRQNRPQFVTNLQVGSPSEVASRIVGRLLAPSAGISLDFASYIVKEYKRLGGRITNEDIYEMLEKAVEAHDLPAAVALFKETPDIVDEDTPGWKYVYLQVAYQFDKDILRVFISMFPSPTIAFVNLLPESSGDIQVEDILDTMKWIYDHYPIGLDAVNTALVYAASVLADDIVAYLVSIGATAIDEARAEVLAFVPDDSIDVDNKQRTLTYLSEPYVTQQRQQLYNRYLSMRFQ